MPLHSVARVKKAQKQLRLKSSDSSIMLFTNENNFQLTTNQSLLEFLAATLFLILILYPLTASSMIEKVNLT